jgi:endonuclease G
VVLLCLVAPLATAQEHEALKYGAPDTGSVIDYGTFIMSYDGRLRSARWVAEKLTKDSLKKNVEREDDFRPDRRIPSEFRAELSDYRGSGFDRGDLAPSGDHILSREVNSSTFFLTNMSPQVGIGFNRHYWQRLETTIRQHALEDSVKGLYVFTGPLCMPKNAPRQGQEFGEYHGTGEDDETPLTVTYRLIGGNHVPVPTHYFKAILVVPADPERSVKLYRFVLPNEKIDGSTDLRMFARSVDFVEHWAGMDLWAKLPDEIEAYKEGTAWWPWGPLAKGCNGVCGRLIGILIVRPSVRGPNLSAFPKNPEIESSTS